MMYSLFITIRWLDVLDILLVAFLIYQLYNIVKGTVAIRIFFGIFALYLFWKLVEALKMELLSDILGQFIGVGVIALIIVFQQELRRFLLYLGNTQLFEENSFLRRLFGWNKKVSDVVKLEVREIKEATIKLSKEKTGALIVIQRDSILDAFLSGGQLIDSKLNHLLLEAIFNKHSPLHDGAVLIHDNRILSAGNVLPVSQRTDLPKHFGMRHRVAIGLSENSDAVTVIVSEETGNISVVFKEDWVEDVTTDKLIQVIEQKLRS
jgi:diadenylate cyclase